MATAGRVLMIPAGNWKSGTAYGMLDVVIHSGSSYVAKKNIINSTVAPPNDEANWQLLAQGYDVTNIVTKSMVTGQNVNDANKIPNSALMYAVKQALDTTNSNFELFKALISGERMCTDPNTTTSIICVFNGWSPDAQNYHPDFKNKMAVLINAWNYSSSLGNLSASRTQIMLSNTVRSRTFSSGSYSDWV